VRRVRRLRLVLERRALARFGVDDVVALGVRRHRCRLRRLCASIARVRARVRHASTSEENEGWKDGIVLETASKKVVKHERVDEITRVKPPWATRVGLKIRHC
jgi:hypothetical protein